MPRPKLKSDDEVLEAATVVLKRCGPIEFTYRKLKNQSIPLSTPYAT
ncbi:hypothetical protein AE14_05416 [Klebsiella pneumoniae UCI 55]|nr:hypothetical protein AE14_05416 [Klebsiella pneumoniae UCI 55]